MEAEARKTLNMVQQWTAATDYTLAELGIQEWVTKARQQANNVLQLVSVRVENESAKVKGELADARKATDAGNLYLTEDPLTTQGVFLHQSTVMLSGQTVSLHQ